MIALSLVDGTAGAGCENIVASSLVDGAGCENIVASSLVDGMSSGVMSSVLPGGGGCGETELGLWAMTGVVATGLARAAAASATSPVFFAIVLRALRARPVLLTFMPRLPVFTILGTAR